MLTLSTTKCLSFEEANENVEDSYYQKWYKNVDYYRIDGSSLGKTRQRCINQFNDEEDRRCDDCWLLTHLLVAILCLLYFIVTWKLCYELQSKSMQPLKLTFREIDLNWIFCNWGLLRMRSLTSSTLEYFHMVIWNWIFSELACFWFRPKRGHSGSTWWQLTAWLYSTHRGTQPTTFSLYFACTDLVRQRLVIYIVSLLRFVL